MNSYTGVLVVEIYTEAVIEVIQISYIIYDRYIPLKIDFVDYYEEQQTSSLSIDFIGLSELCRSPFIYLGLRIGSLEKGLVCKGNGCP